MASIVDDRGFNQGFVPTKALIQRTQRRCDALVAEMDLSRRSEVLELGCGTGELSYLLAQKSGTNVIGTDLCKPFVERARETYQLSNLSYEMLDLRAAEQLESMAGRFDYVVGNGILHHVYHDLDDVLTKLKSLLRPGGKLLFWEPNLLNPYVTLIFNIPFLRKVAKLEPDEMAFTPSFIRAKLEKAGLEVLRVETRDFLLPNTPDLFIRPVVHIGDILERISALNWLAQSIFISASRRD